MELHGPTHQEPEFRQAIFGNFGLVSFCVDQDTETIRIFDITWTG